MSGGNWYEVIVGDCIKGMQSLEAGSVHTCITSPPYFGLRDYQHECQIGLEDTPEAYVARLVEVFREVRRVLRDDGTLWLNLGDSYVGATSQHKDGGSQGHNSVIAKKTMGGIPSGGRGDRNRAMYQNGLAMKQLIGIPWRVAFALQSDGWYLRQDIIWHKPNPMPESVTDRCTKAHEYIFLLSKSPRYYFDQEAVKEPAAESSMSRLAQPTLAQQEGSTRVPGKTNGNMKAVGGAMRNRRSVWTVTTKPFKGAHFATFPPDLIEPCILAGAPERCCAVCGAPHERITSRGTETPHVDGSDIDRFGTGEAGVHRKVGGQYQKWLDANPKMTVGWKPTCACNAGISAGVVLDPFGGSGTTAGVALKHGRNAILCELNPDYDAMIDERVDSIRFGKPKPARKA
jgi:DNA modification methylase